MIERVATLQEVETYYSIDDAADMNDALDAWHEAENKANKPKR